MNFINRPCSQGQVKLKNGTPVCAWCPDTLNGAATVADAERLVSEMSINHPQRPGGGNQGRFDAETKYNNKQGKAFCGETNHYVFGALYEQCYGNDPNHPHFGFRNPFGHSRLGTPGECFQNGQRLGRYLGPPPPAPAAVLAQQQQQQQQAAPAQVPAAAAVIPVQVAPAPQLGPIPPMLPPMQPARSTRIRSQRQQQQEQQQQPVARRMMTRSQSRKK